MRGVAVCQQPIFSSGCASIRELIFIFMCVVLIENSVGVDLEEGII